MVAAAGGIGDFITSPLMALKLDHFFGERIYGALDDYKKFSKAMVIENSAGEV